MGVAEVVQFAEQPLDLRVDPGVLAAGRGAGAAGDGAGEVLVHRHVNASGQHGARQPARQVEAVERQDAAALRVEPVEPLAAPRLGHREQAMAIGAQHQLGGDLHGAPGHVLLCGRRRV